MASSATADPLTILAALGEWDTTAGHDEMRRLSVMLNALYEELDAAMHALAQVSDDCEDWVTSDGAWSIYDAEKSRTERESIMVRLSVDVPELVERLVKVRESL